MTGIFQQDFTEAELFGVFEYKVKLLVVKGSVAHRYAAKEKIRFRLVEEDVKNCACDKYGELFLKKS